MMTIFGSRFCAADARARVFAKLAVLLLMAGSCGPALAAPLQCVPYARELSGIAIHGNADSWWSQADGRYARGSEPEVGSVLAFRPTRAMPLGHVAVVEKIVDDRHVLLDHANWSRPGMIEERAMAMDVSEAGDWSQVRVWYAPIGALGSRTNPTYGFIYADNVAPAFAAAASDPQDGSQDAAG